MKCQQHAELIRRDWLFLLAPTTDGLRSAGLLLPSLLSERSSCSSGAFVEDKET